ncbi:MAG TPA: DUF1565 domain-containing protein, partial [Anaerolineae bacterium]|nr:DUF1565 domain-containing protein [Anaerolineae bacterium]
MMKNEKILSRTGWGRVGMHLSLAGLVVLGLLLALSAPWPSPVSAATTRYVAPGGSCGGANPCYAKIQDAINAASSGDTIKVAQGTYNENLVVNKAVSLLGGFSTSDWSTRGPASSTTINGSGSSDSVIRVSANATIDNFTITGGSGHSGGSYTFGGGIYTEQCSPTISHNIIQDNSANWGGGIIVNTSGQPQIIYNTISGNTATSGPPWGWGGGILVAGASPYIRYNTISNNHAYWGGGFLLWQATPTIEGNTISGNQALGSEGVGGAFYAEESAPIIKNNIIANNVAQLYGDGIYLMKPYPYSGPQPQIINNTIVSNKYSDSERHAGILLRDNVSPIIRNNIVALNGSGIRVYPWGSAVYPILSNNDVWGNSVADYSNLS